MLQQDFNLNFFLLVSIFVALLFGCFGFLFCFVFVCFGGFFLFCFVLGIGRPACAAVGRWGTVSVRRKAWRRRSSFCWKMALSIMSGTRRTPLRPSSCCCRRTGPGWWVDSFICFFFHCYVFMFSFLSTHLFCFMKPCLSLTNLHISFFKFLFVSFLFFVWSLSQDQRPAAGARQLWPGCALHAAVRGRESLGACCSEAAPERRVAQ